MSKSKNIGHTTTNITNLNKTKPMLSIEMWKKVFIRKKGNKYKQM